MMAELALTAETKQQIERDYRNKNDAFLSLSTEFLALKVSFKVGVKDFIIIIIIIIINRLLVWPNEKKLSQGPL